MKVNWIPAIILALGIVAIVVLSALGKDVPDFVKGMVGAFLMIVLAQSRKPAERLPPAE